MARLAAELGEQQAEGERLDTAIKENLGALGFPVTPRASAPDKP